MMIPVITMIFIPLTLTIYNINYENKDSKTNIFPFFLFIYYSPQNLLESFRPYLSYIKHITNDIQITTKQLVSAIMTSFSLPFKVLKNIICTTTTTSTAIATNTAAATTANPNTNNAVNRMTNITKTSTTITTSRRLQRLPFTNIFARCPYVRTKHEYRSGWKSFGSQQMNLCVDNKLLVIHFNST